MAGLSTNSSHRVMTDETHTTLIEGERGAATSTRAILDVVGAVRTGAAVRDIQDGYVSADVTQVTAPWRSAR